MGNDSDQGSADQLEALRARIGELDQAAAEGQCAADELRRVSANLEALLENTDDFILFSDRNASPVFFNTAYAAVMNALLGIDMRPGLKPHELLPDPAARELWESFHRRALAGESFKVEYPHPGDDGTERHFEVSYNPVRKDGEIVGFSEFTRDITDRKRAEKVLVDANERLEREVARRTADLQQSEARFRALTERSSDITLIIDRDGNLSYVSPSVRRYGYTEDQVLGHPPSMFAHPDDAHIIERALSDAAAAPGRAIVMPDFRGRHAEGHYIDLEGVVRSMIDVAGVNRIVFNGRDVTERRRLETRLRQAEKMDAIGQLAGGIAHDFNNQLTGILAYADLLRKKLEDAGLRGFAEQIIQAARRSSDLTGQLLAFARKGHYRSVPTNVNRTVTEVAELLRRSIDKRVEIVVSPCADSPITVGDPGQLHNALLNLALNARDAMPDGGTLSIACEAVTLDTEACERLALSGARSSYVKVSVRDSGVGMDSDTRDHMFEPFFTTKGPGKGTGMGLASVYGTIRSHDGAVSVTSAPGAGTTVDLYLPLAPVEAQPDRDATTESPLPVGGRVLIVDDEHIVRESLTRLLSALAYEVTACADGVEAVALFEKKWQSFDLVIIDMIMPRMDGRQTLRALRAIDPDARVLMVSGFAREGTGQDAIDQGACGFLQKPFDLDQLATMVGQARKARPER